MNSIQGDVVYLHEENCTLYIADGEIVVNAPGEGSDDLDFMFHAFCNDVIEHEAMTVPELKESFPSLKDEEFV